MTFEEVRSAIMNMSDSDRKRLILEVIPSIWPKACIDDACVSKFRELVDEATIKEYREQHLGGI